VGFPIRKSSDQSSFAAPQGLSQRTTSFIASQRQGIHRMPLRHLIALMIDVRHSRDETRISARALGRTQAIRKTCPWISPRTFACQRIRLSEVRRSEDQKIRRSEDQIIRCTTSLVRRISPTKPNASPLHDVKHPQACSASSRIPQKPRTPDP
jgi:hypothetical protein